MKKGSKLFDDKRISKEYQALKQEDFIIDELRELRPDAVNFTDVKLYERRKRIPMFLFFAVHKE